jgi:uncharacterized repeat protein (TIGR03803 family)
LVLFFKKEPLPSISLALIKLSKSAFIVSASVVGMTFGNPGRIEVGGLTTTHVCRYLKGPPILAIASRRKAVFPGASRAPSGAAPVIRAVFRPLFHARGPIGPDHANRCHADRQNRSRQPISAHGRPGRGAGRCHAGLAIDSAGTLYGSTLGYGAHNFGVAFSLSPPAAGKNAWSETVLHAFRNGNDGSYPQGALILDPAGALYGATSNSGPNATGLGIVFKLVPPHGANAKWHERVLFDFESFQSSAAHPAGALAMDSAGALYGTSVAGGAGQMGVLFKLTPPAGGTGPWTESELEQFYGNGFDGAQPTGGVVLDPMGTVFGTTYEGGTNFYGAVFEVTQ